MAHNASNAQSRGGVSFEEIVDQFESAWQRGGDPAIQEFLSGASAELRGPLLIELIHVDLEYRVKAGQEVRVESYLQNFQQLSIERDSILELIAAEYYWRTRRFGACDAAEFLRRFPQYAAELPSRLETPATTRTRHRSLTVKCSNCGSVLAADAISNSSDACPNCGSALSQAGDTNSFLASPADDTQVRRRRRTEPASSVLPRQFADYELLAELGRGGMGIVYRARQLTADRIVALKVIRADRLADLRPADREAVLSRFSLEAQLAARLDHAHLVTVYEVGHVGDQPFYSMKYVKGQSLHEMLRVGPLENRRAAQYLESAARGVHEAHQQGILHRDLKPHNILVEAKSDRALVADFGLAKLAESDSGLSMSGDVFGTPPYMSPEQVIDSSRVTALSDVYSLGATLYHSLTGRAPFQAATAVQTLEQVVRREPASLRSLNAAVAADLETICLKAIAKEPARRYPTAKDLADDLHRYLAGEPIKARPVGPVERTWRWCRRNPVVASLVGAVALALLGGTIVSSFFALAAANREREAISARTDAENNLTEANRQRERAEEGFREARQTVDNYYTSISESKLLNVPNMQPLRRELLEAALDYYRRAITTYGDDPAVQSELAATYMRVGHIMVAIDSIEEALPYFTKASEILEQTFRQNPSHGEIGDRLAQAYYNAASKQANIGRVAEAKLAFGRSIEVAERIVRDHPDNRDFRFRLSNCYGLLAGSESNFFRQPEAAEASYNKAITILTNLLTDEPDSTKYLFQLSEWYLRLSRLQAQSGGWAKTTTVIQSASETSCRKAVEYCERIVQLAPEELKFQFNLAMGYYVLAGRVMARSQMDEAELWCNKALELAEKLARENPAVHKYQWLQSMVHSELADVLIWEQRATDAEQHALMAIDLSSQLSRVDPSDLHYAHTVSEHFRCYGRTLAMSSKWPESAAAFAHAWQIDPTFNVEGKKADSLFATALVQLAAGMMPEYQASCRELLSRFAAQANEFEGYNIALACVLNEQSVDDWNLVLKTAEHAVAKMPINPVFAVVAGAAQFRLGQFDLAVKTLSEAIGRHQLAIIVQPNRANHILLSQMIGEVFLAKCFCAKADVVACHRHAQTAQKIMERLEKSPLAYSEDMIAWAIPAGITIVKRELQDLSRAELPQEPVLTP